MTNSLTAHNQNSTQDKKQDKNKRKGQRPDFEKFFTDPKLFFTETPDLECYEKALFGFCASRKSLQHALLALNHICRNDGNSLLKRFELIHIDIKNIMLSLISTNSATLRVCDLLTKLSNCTSGELWTITLNDLVDLFVQSTKVPEESLYTLAIRFFCASEISDNVEKAKILYEKLLLTGITPHSRTFIPFLECCKSIEELNKWHNSVQKDLLAVPSIEFYETFFTNLFRVGSDADFQEAFEVYCKFYPYITPVLSQILTKNLNNRNDLKIMRDGLVYLNNDDVAKSPIHKLELFDLSYEEKCELANVFMTYKTSKQHNNVNALRNFESFVQRYEIAWDIVIDGANVALYNNSDRFRHDYIISILKWARARSYRVLVILHNSRKDSRLERFINKDLDNFNLYYTPSQHNDDHFSLYAALTRDSLIISNDEFKDHTNDLRQIQEVYGKKFLEWRTSHQIFFTFNFSKNKGDDVLELNMPSKFSKIIQKKGSLIFAPVYDPKSNPTNYLENFDKIEGWIIVEVATLTTTASGSST